jgi:cytochrome oxidase assembly protein ShyY1
MRRAAEKEAIEARLSARESASPVVLGSAIAATDDIEYRHVVVKGEFVADWPVYLDNRPYRGVAGFYLLMPFKVAGSDRHILVARGWLPRDPVNRSQVRPTETPVGPTEIRGSARRNPGHVLQLGRAATLRPGEIVQNVDIAEFGKASKLSMAPFMIEQQDGAQDGLVRDWPRPSSGVEKHFGYAFQWYALAATAFIFFLITGCRGSFRD